MKRFLFAIVILLCAWPCFGEMEANQIVLVRRKGTVVSWNETGKKWQDLPEKSQIQVGTFIKTEKESEGIVAFGKKAVITVAENTAVRIAASTFEKDQIKAVKIQAPRGKVWSAVEKLSSTDCKFEIETPNALAGVRGTVFMVGFSPEDNSSKVSVVQGEVGVSSKFAAGLVILKENMSTTVVANKPPIPPQVLEEKEKQEWEQWKQNIPFSEIGIVGGIAEINAMQIQEASRIVRELGIAQKGSKKVLKDFEDIESAILLFYADTRDVPKRLDELMKDPGVANWQGPYLGVGTNFMDPYGHRYFYRLKETPGGKKYVELSCAGLIGAAGDTYGEERKVIFIDKLQEQLEKKLQQSPQKQQ